MSLTDNFSDLQAASSAAVAVTGMAIMENAIFSILGVVATGQPAPTASLDQIDDAVNAVGGALQLITE